MKTTLIAIFILLTILFVYNKPLKTKKTYMVTPGMPDVEIIILDTPIYNGAAGDHSDRYSVVIKGTDVICWPLKSSIIEK